MGMNGLVFSNMVWDDENMCKNKFLGVGLKAIWLIYFEEIWNMWRVQELFFCIEEVRKIIMDFSSGKAEILWRLK